MRATLPIFSALISLLFTACDPGGAASMPTATLASGPFEVRLPIPGELEAEESVTITAPDIGGNIKVTMIVDEGVRVAEGDVLAELDRTEIIQGVLENDNALEVATTKITQQKAQLEVKLRNQEDAVTTAELALQRANLRITDSEAVPKVDREGARLDVADATVSLERAKKDLQSARLEGEADLQLLELDARQARIQVDSAKRKLDLATVRSPAAGLVVKAEVWKGGSRGPVVAGDSIWGGTTLLALPNLGTMQAVAWVHETDAELVKVEQEARIILDSHPDHPYSAKVKKVADLAVKRDRDDKSKYLKVTLGIEPKDELLKPGMTIRAEILVDHQPEVLTVPQEAVFYDGVTPTVYRRAAVGWDRVTVTLGRANDTHVVVTSGLSSGDVVSLVDPDRWSRGEGEPAAKTAGAEAPSAAPAAAPSAGTSP